MRLSDYENLSIRNIHLIVDSPTPIAGTHIKRTRPSHNAFDRLFLNFDTVVTQTHDSGCVTSGDGDVVLIPRNVVYTDEILTAGTSLILYLEFVPEIPDGIYKWSFADNLEMKQRFLHLQALWKQKKTGYYIECMRIIYSILSMIIASEKANYTGPARTADINPAIAYLKANFTDPELTIPLLAQHCRLSYSHFRKLFFDIHGVTANTYLQKLRLDYACQLLSLDDYTVTQIAQMSGFSDVYYFSSFFKRLTGMTPTQYQHQKQKGTIHD